MGIGHRKITGSIEWIEERIPGFKFQGAGWYANGTLLVISYGSLYQAVIFEGNAREAFRDALTMPVHTTNQSA